MDNSNFPLKKKLEYLRLKKGLTKTEVSSELGVSPGAYSNWEYGNRTPDLESLKKISTMYNISLDVLASDDISSKEEFEERISKTVQGMVKEQLKVIYNSAFKIGENVPLNKNSLIAMENSYKDHINKKTNFIYLDENFEGNYYFFNNNGESNSINEAEQEILKNMISSYFKSISEYKNI